MKNGKLAEQVAVVTGASKGIGAEKSPDNWPQKARVSS